MKARNEMSLREYKALVAFETKRTNSPAFKASYESYIAFLLPKIWESPDVRISDSLREYLIKRELMFLNRDIREINEKIQRLYARKANLQTRSGRLDKEEVSELSRIDGTVKKQYDWIRCLQEFKQTLSEYLA